MQNSTAAGAETPKPQNWRQRRKTARPLRLKREKTARAESDLLRQLQLERESRTHARFCALVERLGHDPEGVLALDDLTFVMYLDGVSPATAPRPDAAPVDG